MVCKKCKSENMIVTKDTQQRVKGISPLRKMGRAILIIMTCGLWWFVPKRTGTHKTKTVAICQDCGYTQGV